MSLPKLEDSHGSIHHSYSIDFSQGDMSLGSVDMDEGDSMTDDTDRCTVGQARPQLKEPGTNNRTAVKSNKYSYILNARSMSPRPYLATQASLRSTASSPGGLRCPLQEKLRSLSRAQRQELLIRTGAPIPIARSNSLEDGDGGSHAAPSSTSPKSPQLMHLHSVRELRRDSSILDRTLSDSLTVPNFSNASNRISQCCSSDELDHAIPRSPTLVNQTSIRSARSDSRSTTNKTNHVQLHIYDLITSDTLMQLPFGCMCEIGKCFKELNDGLHLMGTGAYHVGVEVNGIEYAYGACPTPGRSGVFPCTPKRSPGYQYRTTIDFGERAVARRSNVVVIQQDHSVELEDDVEYLDGRDIVRGMAKQYMGADYDILRKNCCTFARELCFRFGIKQEEIPSWFSNLAESGAMTHDLALATVQPLRVFSICEPDLVVREGFEIKMGNSVTCQ